MILLIQGNTGGALLVRRTLDALGCKAKVDIAEMDNFPHSCWRRGPRAYRADRHQVAICRSQPSRATDRHGIFGARAMFPTARGDALDRPYELHQRQRHAPRRQLRRQRRQDRRGRQLQIYADGVTPMVARLYEAINAERVAVAAALGAKVRDLADWFEITYGVRGKTLSETSAKAHHPQRRALSGHRHAEEFRS